MSWLFPKYPKGNKPTQYYGKPDIQKYFPYYLRQGTANNPSTIDQGLGAGITNFSRLLKNPGSFSGNISQAIAPRVAMESEMINRNTQGQLSEASGAAARSGSGGGFAQALAASIQQAGVRQKAESVRTAQMDSAKLERTDIASMFPMLQLLQSYSEQGRKYNQKRKDAYDDQINKSASGYLSLLSGLGKSGG